jgi:hypothetical protein
VLNLILIRTRASKTLGVAVHPDGRFERREDLTRAHRRRSINEPDAAHGPGAMKPA